MVNYMKTKITSISIIAAIVATLFLTACDPASVTEHKLHPEVSDVGTFDGCEVKYVNRGYRDDSFFLAKCGDTATQTSIYAQGKTTARVTSITQQINTLNAEKQALEKVEADRQSALKKLSPEERAALLGFPASSSATQ